MDQQAIVLEVLGYALLRLALRQEADSKPRALSSTPSCPVESSLTAVVVLAVLLARSQDR